MKKLRGFSAKVLTMVLAIILLFPAAAFTSDAATCQSRIEIGTYKGKTTKKSMLSQTIFKIYYIDKHTKKEETKSVGVYYLKD